MNMIMPLIVTYPLVFASDVDVDNVCLLHGIYETMRPHNWNNIKEIKRNFTRVYPTWLLLYFFE